MKFKEALIAHLQGEKVEIKTKNTDDPWEPLMKRAGDLPLSRVNAEAVGSECEFRLAPRTIFVNGVEVPAPESVAPAMHSRYYVPSVIQDDYYAIIEWKEYKQDLRALEDGVVYLNKEDAIARAKAMLLTSDK